MTIGFGGHRLLHHPSALHIPDPALVAKTSTAETELMAGQQPTVLSVLSNQLSALDGKHGLDQSTVDLIESMIAVIRGQTLFE